MKEPRFLQVKITFTKELLGSQPNDEELFASYMATKAPTKEQTLKDLESFNVNEEIERGTSVFYRDENGNCCLRAYMVTGFFKEACSALRRIPESLSKDLTAYKKVIDLNIFVEPDYIPIVLPEGSKVGMRQRPLRAETAQGPRVALACSESIPPGSTVEFEVELLESAHEQLFLEWLDFGRHHGFGQWRNAGNGRFDYEYKRLN
ncbi:hypothetical protein FWF93_01960 [Candidatus Saccharibacteria bacterium]|nr:hypothetical protein [Candidatus Saccharibacteria bacterium]